MRMYLQFSGLLGVGAKARHTLLSMTFVLGALAMGAPAIAEDCNANGIDDACDLTCGMQGGPCDVPDCGGNADCNTNGIPDECDLADGTSGDYNGNGLPDECEALFVEQTGNCPGNGSPEAPFCTIGDAVAAAADGDVIIISPGTYVENINLGAKSLTLRSVEPQNWDVVEATVIDGGGAGTVIKATGPQVPPPSKIFISGLTITGGGGDEVGGIQVSNSELTLAYCRIVNNHGTQVGGIQVKVSMTVPQGVDVDCDLLIDHCHITGNAAGTVNGQPSALAGGAELQMFQDGGNWTIQNCYVADNIHQDGFSLAAGGIFILKDNVLFSNTTFKSNRVLLPVLSTHPGGGIKLFQSVGAVVENCTFDSNVPAGLEASLVLAIHDSSFLNNGPVGGCHNGQGGFDGIIADSFFCGNWDTAYWSGADIEDINNTVRLLCDCNNNGTDDDREDVNSGAEPDCNENGLPDSCDIADGEDCNENGVPDACDMADGTSLDEDPADGIPDECQYVAACCVSGGCLMMDNLECLAMCGRSHGPDVTCDDEPYCGQLITGDLDDDGDVDLVDFAKFQAAFTGP